MYYVRKFFNRHAIKVCVSIHNVPVSDQEKRISVSEKYKLFSVTFHHIPLTAAHVCDIFVL
jgi:hypothetical protein